MRVKGDDDEDVEFIINSSHQSWEHDDFVPFEDDEDENARYVGFANQAEHDIEDGFLPKDILDYMYDEQLFHHIYDQLYDHI